MSPYTTRVLTYGELPGYQQFGGLHLLPNSEAVVNFDNLQGAAATAEEARLTSLGFVGGAYERLRSSDFPDEALSAVEEFHTPEAATTELARRYQQVQALPASKAIFTPFSVTGIPGARGFDLSSTGSAGHNIAFADGRYFYLLGVGWPAGTINPASRELLAIVAAMYYQRVHATG
jgi:hypothetical protein